VLKIILQILTFPFDRS